MPKSKITVLITCYNYARYLPQCVHSVLDQEGVDVDILIIDDASSDNSSEVASILAANERRIKVILLRRNIGMVPSVNLGIQESIGDYFVKLDADDLLTPLSLYRSASLLDRYGDASFVYGKPRHFSGEVPPRARIAQPQWTIWPGEQWLTLRYQRGFNCISQPEAMIRTSALREVGQYNESLPHTSDLQMWLRLAMLGPVGRINGVEQGYYRIHPNSMQRTVNAGTLKDFIGRRDAFIDALSSVRKQGDLSKNLELTVRRTLAAQALDNCCRAFDRDQVHAVPVSELIEFAFSTFSTATSLPEWKALECRWRRGVRSRWSPRSLAAALVRRGREEIAHLRWIRTGV